MRDIIIQEAGKNFDTLEPCYQVRVGCETFVFTTKADMQVFLNSYITDPNGVENSYYARVAAKDPEKLSERPPLIRDPRPTEQIRYVGQGDTVSSGEGLGNTGR